VGVQYLSDEYMAAGNVALEESAEVAAAVDGLTLAMAFEVSDGPDGDFEHYISVKDGKVEIGRGHLPDADATIRNSYKTSAKLSQGTLSNQMGFMTGKIKISGSMGVLMKHSRALDVIQETLSGLDIDY